MECKSSHCSHSIIFRLPLHLSSSVQKCCQFVSSTLLKHSFAKNPSSPPTNSLPRNVTSPRPLRTTYTANVYSYSRRILLSSYGAGVLLTLLIVIFGTSAILKNGVVHNSNFSGIMCATRNPDFDELARGSCLAAEPMRKDVKKVKVLFGVLDNGGNNGHEGGLEMDDRRRVGSGQGQGSVGHAAFGVKGTVRRFKKGEKLS